MRSAFTIGRIRIAGLSLVLTACLGLAAVLAATGSHAEPRITKMFAVYKVHFLGAKLGKFKLWIDISPEGYAMRSETRLDMGFILRSLFFKLEGDAESSGKLSAGAPRPRHYALQFETKRKRGKLDMRFTENVVDEVVTEPPMKISDRAVPVTRAHRTDVLDPLSAVFLSNMNHTGKHHEGACERDIAVFDGKHRFNLLLSHKKTVRVKRSGKRGYTGIAVVCRIKYAPVSGHTPNNKGLKFFRKTDDIEIWLVPVPGTRAYVPYHLSLPTPYGKGIAIATVFNIDTADRQSVALVE